MTSPQFVLPNPHLRLCEALSAQQKRRAANTTQPFGSEVDDQALLTLARANDVASIVAHGLIYTANPGGIPAHWHQAHEETHQRISAYLAELDRAAELLAAENIPLIALKNAGIARGIYPCPGCCPMGDVDVLVEKRHFRRAHQILLDDGYHFDYRSPTEEADIRASGRIRRG